MRMLLAIIFTALLSSSSQVYAEASTSSLTPYVNATNGDETTPSLKKANRERMMQAKEKASEKESQMKAIRESFKEKLNTIRDAKKRTLVERIDTKLTTINQKRTAQMDKAYTKISDVLKRLTSKTNEAKIAGKDTTAADTAINAANAAMTTAQLTIRTQAAKTYTVPITDETTLRSTIGLTMSQLQKDLKATTETMQAAKQATTKAAQEVAKLYK